MPVRHQLNVGDKKTSEYLQLSASCRVEQQKNVKNEWNVNENEVLCFCVKRTTQLLYIFLLILINLLTVFS